MRRSHDVIVAGCGLAGALAALTILKKNVNVTIVEKNRGEAIGKKICGELMPQKTLQWLKNEFNISIESYPLKGLEIRTLFGHSSYAPEPLCTVDRWQLGQMMAHELVRRGADIHHSTIQGPLGESAVQGVKTRESAFYSTLTIDCSGVSSVVARKCFSEPPLLGLAYKETLIVRDPVALEYAQLIFDKDMIPSGYFWCFPKDEYTLNVGAGGIGQTSLKEKLEKVIKTLGLTVKRRESPGFGIIPLGRPLPSSVYPGLLVCGDAAHHVNPLTGEGIAPALTAGYDAGKTAVKALENSNVSLEGLWSYNCDFARDYGAVHASLVVARSFLSSLSGRELNSFLEMVTGEDIAHLIKGKIPLRNTWKTVMKTWRHLPFLYRIYVAFNRMNKVRKLYETYPESPETFPSWKEALDSCFTIRGRSVQPPLNHTYAPRHASTSESPSIVVHGGLYG